MVYGCGVDIEEINRFTRHLDLHEPTPSFITDVFTEREISLNDTSLKEIRFALGFSCKEAMFKAFGKSWTNSPLSWKDIELIFRGETPEHYGIELGGYAKDLFLREELKRIDSQVAYTETYVMFQVVLIK